MLIKKPSDMPYSEVTPEVRVHESAKFPGGCRGGDGRGHAGGALRFGLARAAERARRRDAKLGPLVKSPFSTAEPQTPVKDVSRTTTTTTNSAPTRTIRRKMRTNFVTSPWSVSVEGEVNKPRKFDIEELRKLAPLEERIYRHRCVEGVVDRGAVDRLFAQRAAQARGAEAEGEVRRLPELSTIVKQMPLGPRDGDSNCPTSRACGWTKRCTR